MSVNENIIKILETNQNFPALVVDQSAAIIDVNQVFFNYFTKSAMLYDIFDKNTSLLVKNSFIDSKAFSKIQRRLIEIEVNNNVQNVTLLISPFKLENTNYYFVILFWHTFQEHIILYPTIDDISFTRKYNTILNRLQGTFPQTLIEKKNFQYDLDIEKEPIFVEENGKYLFINNSFQQKIKLSDEEIKSKKEHEIFEEEIAQKLSAATELCNTTKNIIVLESLDYLPEDLQQKNRLVKFPVKDFDNNIIATINFGFIEAKRNEKIISQQTIAEKNNKSLNNVTEVEDVRTTETEKEDFAKIEYNPDNFKILNANTKALKLYGYTLQEILKKDITDLCLPEDMQKLLNDSDKLKQPTEFKHIKKDGSIIKVEVETTYYKNNEKTVAQSLIKLKTESEKIKNNENLIAKTEEKEIVKTKKQKPEEIKPAVKLKDNPNISNFLSNLFHELLTPVNVILGFVQEIIDSIDNPTEEQKESATIIKNNKQLLLQTMNTAAQYSQLLENKIPFKPEEFLLDNYIFDLKESISTIIENEKAKVDFEKLNETITLINDRQKLLASVSYFIKFIIKLSNIKQLKIKIYIENKKVYFTIGTFTGKFEEKFTETILELYTSENPFEKKNIGLSPVTVKLARLLNTLTLAEVKKIIKNNSETLAIIFPIGIETTTVENNNETIVTEKITKETEKEEPIETNNSTIENKEINIPKNKQQVQSNSANEKILTEIENDIIKEKEIENEDIVTQDIATEEIVIDKNDKPESITTRLSCLLIEDSVDAQLLFETQMKDFKLLKIVSSLTEALPIIKKYKFDIVYVDINLKGQYNGLDALKIIKQFDNYGNIPIIAVTAYPFIGDREKFLKAGFTDYFPKPLLRENLISALNKLFKKQ